MIADLSLYQSVIFDCDGVIYNSNLQKERLFKTICERFNPEALTYLMAALNEQRGQNRSVIFRHFLKLLPKDIRPDFDLELLVNSYGSEVERTYYSAEKTKLLPRLREFYSGRAFVVSSADDDELVKILDKDKFSDLFDGGIYGGSRTKRDHIGALLANGKLERPVLYFGDGQVDVDVCIEFGFSMVFLTKWSSIQNPIRFKSAKDWIVLDSLDHFFRNITKVDRTDA